MSPNSPTEATRTPHASALFADLYALTMMRAYRDAGMRGKATFSLFSRKLPDKRNFFLAAGLDDVLDALENLHFNDAEIDYLASLGKFDNGFLEELAGLRFTGSVRAVAEGMPVFPNEPFIEITAPIIEAQWVEALVLNQIQLQTILASKAARMVAAADGRRVVDFGSRRAHGCEAAIKGARAFNLAGIDATSNLEAGRRYGIETIGTMAHSFIQAFTREREAFAAFLRSYPETVLLVDTYDTPGGVACAIASARDAAPGTRLAGIRLDSGDLLDLARESRRLLDAAGMHDTEIFASGGLDEEKIATLLEAGAPIDAFGVGTAMSVSEDAPALDIAYKLVAYDERGVMKLSYGKQTLPGPKQVFRRFEDGVAQGDIIARAGESSDGLPLLGEVMRGGKRIVPPEPLETIRRRAAQGIAALPGRVRSIAEADPPYPVAISRQLRAFSEETEQRLRAGSD